MKILLVVNLCFISAACVKASAVLEVSGRVGGDVSIHCSGSWTTNSSSNLDNMYYFCKGVCSKENVLVQKERRSVISRRGRYNMEVDRGAGVVNVTIKGLKKMDAGRYQCGLKNNFTVWHQEVIVKVLDGPTVPPGSSHAATTLRTGTAPSGAAVTPSAAVGRTNKRAATSLTDTTIVIIVSVSLALLVCAIIPLIFYGHWRSNAAAENIPEENKIEVGDYGVENADVASTQTEMRLQSLETDVDAESGAQDASQYATVYQALDPKSLD